MTPKKINMALVFSDVYTHVELQKKLSKAPNFARAYLWVFNKFKVLNDRQFIIEEFMADTKYSRQYAHQILEHLVIFNIINKRKVEKNRSIKFTIGDASQLIEDNVEIAKKTLGID